MADNSPERPTSIRFHYLKSNYFRVIHADGAIGGITPNGFVHMSLFSERAAIPRELVHSITEEGKLGDIIETIAKEGVVREMKVDVMLSKRSAELLHEWLTTQLKKLNQQQVAN